MPRLYENFLIVADQEGNGGGIRDVVNFVYLSGSFQDITTSGSIAKIQTNVLERNDNGVRGELRFVLSDTELSSSGTTIMKMYHTGSANEPRVGIGTAEGATLSKTLEIQSVSASAVGTEMVLKSGRPTLGAEIGDIAGSITYIIDSGSFDDPFVTGAIAQIDTVVISTASEGNNDTMAGNLRIHASPEWIEIMQPVAEFGYRHRTGAGNDSSAILYVSGALIVGGENSSQGDISPLEVFGRQTTGQNAPTSQIIYSGSEFHLLSGSLHVGSGSIFLGAAHGKVDNGDIEFVNFRGQGPIKLGHVDGGGGAIGVDFYSGTTNSARLDTSGNFGIGTGTSILNNKLEVVGNISASGDITTNTFKTIETTIASDSSTTVDTFVVASHKGAIYDYVLYDAGVGARAGQFMVIQDNSNIEFTDNSTPTIGSEATIPSITAAINGSNVEVKVTNGNGYTFKATAKKL